MVVSDGTEMARPFLPAKNFEKSKKFYEALGFKKLLDADVAIFGIGALLHFTELLSLRLGRKLYDAADGR